MEKEIELNTILQDSARRWLIGAEGRSRKGSSIFLVWVVDYLMVAKAGGHCMMEGRK